MRDWSLITGRGGGEGLVINNGEGGGKGLVINNGGRGRGEWTPPVRPDHREQQGHWAIMELCNVPKEKSVSVKFVDIWLIGALDLGSPMSHVVPCH